MIDLRGLGSSFGRFGVVLVAIFGISAFVALPSGAQEAAGATAVGGAADAQPSGLQGTGPVGGADSEVLSFQRNFARASLATKFDVLSQADGKVGMAPLFDLALQFVLQNADLLRDDPAFAKLATLAAKGVRSTGSTQSVQALWRLLMAFRDSETRVAVLEALAALGKGDGQVVENLNQFLANQNNVNKVGITPDLSVLVACVDALGILGDGSSFPVLFSTMIADYPPEVQKAAAGSLKSIRGDYKKYLVDVIRKSPPNDKVAAFRAGMDNENFLPAERGELAEAALDVSLSQYVGENGDAGTLEALRYDAVRELTTLKWSRASSLAVKHFYRVQNDYKNQKVPKERFLEAIDCLGAMGTSEAAQALSLYLGIVNAEMEKSGTFDEPTLLSVIGALGNLGDKVAFDYLLFIGYLPYPDAIKLAAREALNKLKW